MKKAVHLPPLEFPFDEDISELAQGRHIRFAAIEMAVMREFIWAFDDENNGRCWLWTDKRRKCALRRRLDNEPFVLESGNRTKAAACPNSIMTEPLGYLEAFSLPFFAVVEGAPDALAVYDQALRLGVMNQIAPIVMPCTAARFTPESLQALSDKKGRIFIDGDAAGKKAAGEWLEQLGRAGIKTDTYAFKGLTMEDGRAVKDLNDYCRLSAESKLAHLDQRNWPMAFMV